MLDEKENDFAGCFIFNLVFVGDKIYFWLLTSVAISSCPSSMFSTVVTPWEQKW